MILQTACSIIFVTLPHSCHESVPWSAYHISTFSSEIELNLDVLCTCAEGDEESLEVVPQRTTIVEFESPEELAPTDSDKVEALVQPAVPWRTTEDYEVIIEKFEPVEEVVPVDEASPQVAEMPDRVTLEVASKERPTPAAAVEELDITPRVPFTTEAIVMDKPGEVTTTVQVVKVSQREGANSLIVLQPMYASN